MRSWLGDLESMRILIMYFWVGETYLFHISVYIVIVHSSPYLCVFGDDRIICYSGADDVTGEPEDA